MKKDSKLNKRVCLIAFPSKEGIIIEVNNRKKLVKVFWTDKTTTLEGFASIRYI